MNANHHPLFVTAPSGIVSGAAPLLLDRQDSDFVAAMLGELSREDGRDALLATRALERDGQDRLKLFQPLQRRFHVALIEARCDTAGLPRVDPARVERAGMVLRRVRRDAQGRIVGYDGWMKAGGRVRGWLDSALLGSAQADPRPQNRIAAQRTGVAQIDRALLQLRAGHDDITLEESTIPMFVAPPDACAAQRSTLYYGVVPTASGERAEAPADAERAYDGFGADSADFIGHLVSPLTGSAWDFPAAGLSVTARWSDALDFHPEPPPGGALDAVATAAINADKSRLDKFVLLLRQLGAEFDAFGESDAAQALRARLAAITLRYVLQPGETTARSVDAASFLRTANDILLAGEDGAFEMPASWPALSSGDALALRHALHTAMLQRFRSTQGRPGRFDDPDAEYVLRAFVCTKAQGHCPPRTWWSGYGEPFVIAPWWEAASDPVTIALPNLGRRDVLKSMKPNVSFAVPPELQNLLSASARKLLDGEGSKSGIGIGWLCSFSIPVITFCAFIVLNLFLSLFHIVFRWLFFIKICIPYPKAK